MKRVSKIVIFATAIALLAVCLTACNFFNFGDKKTTHSVVLELDGGEGVKAADFILGEKLVEPQVTPTKSGYIFDGWYVDEDLTVEPAYGENITADITIYAKWTARGYVATFVIGGGEQDRIVDADSEGLFHPVTVNREGYELVGWYADRALTEEADFTEVATEDTTFYARWALIEYTITYDCGTVASAPLGGATTYTVEDTVILLSPSNMKAGYEFLGWYVGTTLITEIPEGSAENYALVARFISHNKAVEEVVGGKVEGDTVRVGVSNSTLSITFAEIITVSDKATFVVKDGINVIESADIPEGNSDFTITVTAEDGTTRDYFLIVTRHERNTVGVTFFYFEGKEDSSKRIPAGSTVSAPEDFVRTGYEFDTWYADEDCTDPFDFNDAITTDTVIYGKYLPIEYSITYDVGSWNNSPDNVSTYTVEERVTLSAPDSKLNAEDERYEFGGWYLGSTLVTEIEVGNVGDKTLVAHFRLKNSQKDAVLSGTYSEDITRIYADELFDYLSWGAWMRDTSIEVEVLIPSDEYTSDYLADAVNAFNRDQEFDAAGATNISYRGPTDEGEYKVMELTVTMVYAYPNKKAAETDRYSQLTSVMHTFSSDRADDYEGFFINRVENAVNVSDTDQLLYAVLNGYRPVPMAGTSAERIYEKAKEVLRANVDDGMTDVEKAHAIFDWIVVNVAYDHDLLELATELGEAFTDAKEYNGFALEGVFDDKRAVCDGMSKAFALLCNMEGIECVQVVGQRNNGEGHAWNKFRIDGEWFVADPTSGGLQISITAGPNGEALAHRYFMMTDEELLLINTPDEGKDGHADKIADTDYNIYAVTYFTVDGTKYDCSLNTAAEWTAMEQFVKKVASETEGTFILDIHTPGMDRTDVQAKFVAMLSSAGLTSCAVAFDTASETAIVILIK